MAGRSTQKCVPRKGADGKTWHQAGAHILFGIVAGSLVFRLVAAGIMFIVQKVWPARGTGPSAVSNGNR